MPEKWLCKILCKWKNKQRYNKYDRPSSYCLLFLIFLLAEAINLIKPNASFMKKVKTKLFPYLPTNLHTYTHTFKVAQHLPISFIEFHFPHKQGYDGVQYNKIYTGLYIYT